MAAVEPRGPGRSILLAGMTPADARQMAQGETLKVAVPAGVQAGSSLHLMLGPSDGAADDYGRTGL